MDNPPIFIPPYRLSLAEREFLKKEIDTLLECKIIEPSNSPWSFPIILVPKKDGSKRLCVDFRKLNNITVTEFWPVPRVKDILDRFGESEWFTTLDLASEYWQVNIDQNSKSCILNP